MNKHKRLLSLLLAVVMVIGMVPLTAVAQDGETQPAVASCEYCKVDLVEGALHSVGCPTTCTCDPKPAEGEAHAVGCPLNLTPVTTSLDGETTGNTTGNTTNTTGNTTSTTEGTTAATTQATTEATTVPTTEATTEATTVPSTEETSSPIEEVEKPVYYGLPKAVTFLNPAPLGDPVVGQAPVKMKFASPFSLNRSGTEPAQENDLVLNKTVTPETGNEFTLTLESYATGSDGVMNKVPIPSDIVLVLDESGSMNDCIECGHEIEQHGSEGIQDENGNEIADCKEYNEYNKCLTPVYGSEIDKSKYYLIYYKNGTTRKIDYCTTCSAWFTHDSSHFRSSPTHSGWAKWTPFDSADQTPTYNDGVEHVVQFYKVCDHDTHRTDALKGAVREFLSAIYENSKGKDGQYNTPDDVNNRIAIASYCNNETAYYYTKNDSGTRVAATESSAVDTLRSTITEQTIINNAIDNVKDGGSTPTHLGMQAAKWVFEKNPLSEGEERNRVVILFTDGSPGGGYRNDKNSANGAIGYSFSLKESGATVYCVGLYPGADASNPEILPNYDENASGVTNPQFYANGNRFLHLVSSNYPTAKNLDETGTVADLEEGEGYYLSTDNEQGLYDAFGKLASVIKPGEANIELGSSAVMMDIVTQYFEIPDNASDITAWTETYTGKTSGKDTWSKDEDSVSMISGGTLELGVDGNTVTVTNFDFTENYVAINKDENDNDVPRGKKLVLEIKIKPVDGFLGGDSIFTNEGTSGIYADANAEEPIKTFPIPDVNVPVKEIIPQTLSKDIYLSQQVSLPELVNVGTYAIDENGDGEINPATEVFTVDTIRNGYVDIEYVIDMPEGMEDITYTIHAGDGLTGQGWSSEEIWPFLTEDMTYPVSCTVTSVNKRENSTTGTGSSSVYVYKPVVTFQDSSINLGQTPDYENENLVKVEWKHGDDLATDAVQGVAPTLVYTYNPSGAAFTEDTPVTVLTVTAQKDGANFIPVEQEIIDHVTFWRKQCDVSWCDNKTADVEVNKGGVNFIVHLNTFDLTIKKEGADLTLDPNSSFLFRVTGPNEFSMDVVINGNNQVVIKGLPIPAEGTTPYTVTELTDWSWRYEPVENGKTADGRNVKTVEFTNERKKIYWLDGEAYVKNAFTGSTTNS